MVLWDVNEPGKGQVVAKVEGSVYALAFLAKSNQLLIACNQDGFHLVDLDKRLEGWNFPLSNIQIFRIINDENIIWAAGSGGNLLRINLSDLEVETLRFGNGSLRSLSLNQARREIAIGSSDGTISIFSLEENKNSYTWKGHQSTVFGLSFYPNDQELVSVGKDAKLSLWVRENSDQLTLKKSIPAHLFGIHDVAIHPSLSILATCSMDKTIKIWDSATLKLLRVLDKSRHAGHGHSINQLLWLSGPELLLSCSDDRTITAWDIFE